MFVEQAENLKKIELNNGNCAEEGAIT